MYIITKQYHDDSNDKMDILYVQHNESDISYDECFKRITEDVEKDEYEEDKIIMYIRS
jgi:nitrogen fixation-related uncharacterized protein